MTQPTIPDESAREVQIPSDEEDAEITRAAESDPDNPPWTDDDWARARPVTDFPEIADILRRHGKLGRPPLPESARKQRVTLYLDRDIVAALKADGKGWKTRANAALRKALGCNRHPRTRRNRYAQICPRRKEY